MLNIDQARAGGEGTKILSIEEEKQKNPEIFQSKDQEVKFQMPDGWRAKGNPVSK